MLGDVNLAPWAIVLVDSWMWTPYVMLLLLAGLRSIPTYIYEAAEIDGANAWHRFRHISIPGIRPVILIVFMISTVSTINSFEAIWLTTGGGPADATLTLPVFAYRGLTTFQIGQSAAAALSMVPLILLFVVLILRKLKKD